MPPFAQRGTFPQSVEVTAAGCSVFMKTRRGTGRPGAAAAEKNARPMRGLSAAGVLLFLVAAGCSTVENSHLQKAEMLSAYERGDNAAVLEEIHYKLRDPAWYNTSVVNTGDEVMWRLEAGSLNFHLGNFQESIEQFKIAEKLIAEYDDRARISVRDVGAEAGGAVTNLNTLPYRGFCRDRIALSIYKSLAYLGTGDESAFRAQLRRLRSEQKKIQDDYREFFEQEKAKLQEAEKRNLKIAGDSRNADFNAGLKEVREIAHRGYGNFLNPMAIFLSGLGSLRDGNFDNARIDFQRLYEAMPGNPMIQRYYVTVLNKADRPVPEALHQVKPFAFPLERECVFVIFANGRSAAFRQVAVSFPIMAAWPMCEFYRAPFGSLEVEADGGKSSSVILADMDGILAQEFEERLPGMTARIVLGTLLKEGAYYGGLVAIGNAGMDPTVKLIAMLAAGIGGAAYRSAMNTADTRSWELLPKEFQLAQFPMPENREVTMVLRGNGGRRVETVRIPVESRSAIIFVSAPSARNVRCHVLPIKSR